MFTQLVKNQPESPDALSDLGVALMHRARALSLLGRDDVSSASSYDAALAMASAAAMHHSASRRNGLETQAISLLRDLNHHGYFRGESAAALTSEPRFAGLRRHPDFPKP